MTARDDLVVMREFGLKVAKALNDAGVRKPHDRRFSAVMVIVGDPDTGREPIGGSINFGNQASDDYDDKDPANVWYLIEQLEMPQRLS